MGLNSKRRRGFFFSGAAVVLLVILTASVMLWISAQNSRSARAQFLTEGQALLAFKHSFSDGSYEDGPLRRASEVALYETVKNAKDTGFFSGINTGNKKVRTFFCGRLGAGALGNWAKSVEELGKQVGLEVEIKFDYDTNPNSCNIEMGTHKTAKVTFPGTYKIIGSEGTQMNGKLEGVLSDLDLNGYDDAYIYIKSNKQAVKQVFFKDGVGTTAASVAPSILVNGVRGKGFVYGKTTRNPSSDSYCLANKDKCIVVIDNVNNYAAVTAGYAGVILRALPTDQLGNVVCDGSPDPVPSHLDTGNCLDCLRYIGDGDTQSNCAPPLGVQGNSIDRPFVAVSSFNEIGSYVLIDSTGADNTAGSSTYHRIWNIEKMRAMSVCGFYVQNNDGLNFLERLVGSQQTGQASGTRIEGFAIGNGWADNNPGNGATIYSSVDHAFFDTPQMPGLRVKGMPGCRNALQCSTETPEGDGSPFGHFALDLPGGYAHATDYGALNLLCSTGAPCD